MKWPIVVAVILIVAGILLALAALVTVKFDWKLFDTVQYEQKEQTVTADFADVAVKAETYDVVIMPATGGDVRVVYDAPTGNQVDAQAEVKDGKLTVSLKDTRKWYQKLAIFNFHTPTVTLYLPAGAYGALDVSVTTGEVRVEKGFSFTAATVEVTTGDVHVNALISGGVTASFTTGDGEFSGQFGSLTVAGRSGDVNLKDLTVAGALAVTTTTGEVEMARVSCSEAAISGTTGEFELKDVSVAGNMRVKLTTGDVKCKNTLVGGHLEVKGGSSDIYLMECDAGTLFIDVTTGTVRGNLLTDKRYLATTTTGEVQVPRTDGPLCEIHTTTGDIDFLGMW